MRSPGCPPRSSTPTPKPAAATRTTSWLTTARPRSPASPELACSRGSCASCPGETAHARDLPGDLQGDLLAECVSAADREIQIGPPLDFHPQGPPSPPWPRGGVHHAVHCPGRCLGGGDDGGVNSTGQPARTTSAV